MYVHSSNVKQKYRVKYRILPIIFQVNKLHFIKLKKEKHFLVC